MIAFCYLFTALALLGAILPWLTPALFHQATVGVAPVGILRGCVAGTSADTSDTPPGITCGDTNENYQWVFNIGGVVDGKIRSGQEPASQQPLPAGGAVEAASAYRIRGGVVVPLYILVLAGFGGAVSMTRRVPEYQRRAMSSQDPMTNEQAREYLVFQIMQVATAPMIAITAYYIIHPTNAMWSVVLGFGSGFASEPILLMIRGLVEKLSPAEPSKSSLVTVRVDPPNKVLEPGKSQQFTASVSGVASSEVTWLIVPSDAGHISQSGYYTAPTEAGKTVTITACSVADRTKSASASVTVKPAGAE